MATQTDIPSDLTNDEKASVFQILDDELNSGIFYALLYGIYTGILAVTLWNIYYQCSHLGDGYHSIHRTISTILADLYIIWCCWMVWGQRWLVVLLPICSLVAAIVTRTMYEYYNFINAPTPMDVSVMLYISFILATTLYCTLVIIYRIVAVAGVRHGAMGRLGVYRRFIEVLVESSALYSISLILDLALTTCNDYKQMYVVTIAGIAKGVAPTLLVGRAAAGHTRPGEDSDGSTVSSLHFQTSSAHSMTSSQHEESTIQSSVLAMDIEAQPEQQVIEQDTAVAVSTTSEVVISD
ncbi:hypothetical protein ARMSODRAFT_1033672 [Armillaria solidipes]|uniref:Uncharacterized protein n=1 Tax=Armillaria solidipes TaxID=1076256 RepID=A0A2H3BMC7_9AGAR|nr:hypothetical protein ARMSODRAFT_1033672 [Armillaria solidipes]